jgi:hypothetical protein
MERSTDVMETTIPKGRTLRIQDGKDLDLKVVSGCLWVTSEHDKSDVVLQACDTLRVSRNGLRLAHAFEEVRLHIAYPVEAGAPSLTLGGGCREFGASVAAAMLADWMREFRGWIAAGVRERAARPGRLGMNAR